MKMHFIYKIVNLLLTNDLVNTLRIFSTYNRNKSFKVINEYLTKIVTKKNYNIRYAIAKIKYSMNSKTICIFIYTFILQVHDIMKNI